MKNPAKHSDIKWAFFGSSNFSVVVLNELKALGLVPQLIVTTPDKPRGRGLKIAPGPVREWADAHNIQTIAPATLKTGDAAAELRKIGTEIAPESRAKSSDKKGGTWDVFLIASYGKIVPAEILDIPTRKTLNIHPSLLPKFRGPTPLESAILEAQNANETGVTIMQVDEQVDHGPIVAARPLSADLLAGAEWPAYYHDLETVLAREGAKLFAEILPGWVANDGSVKATEQNHTV